MFNREPVAYITVIMTVLALLAEFGLPLTDSQETAVQAVLVAVGALWARSQVTPAE